MGFGFKFWGVRGSIPTSPTLENIQGYVEDSIEYIVNNRDKSKEELIKEIYDRGFVTPFGNNTSCVELINDEIESDEIVVFDAGSGLKWLGDDIVKNRPNIKKINIFISHTHWDHISGFPFFTPAYIPKYEINIYSAVEGIEQIFVDQQGSKTFPVQLKDMASTIIFHEKDVKDVIEIEDYKISMKLNDHPGKAYSFKIEYKDKSVIYMTDSEVNMDNIDIFQTYYSNFLKNVDIIVFDAQYDYLQSYSELSDKAGWGHSSSIIGVDICHMFKIKKLVLFHYEPSDVDKEIERHYKQAVYYKKTNQYDYPLEIHNSIERRTLTVD